jgi:hypothetical protein
MKRPGVGVLHRGAREQLAGELRERREAHRAEHAVRVHVLDAVVHVVTTRAHLLERRRVHRVLLGRPTGHRVEPDVRQFHALERPHVDAGVLAHELRRRVLVLRREVPLEDVGRFDDVVVDAHQDQVLDTHGRFPLVPWAAPAART